MVLVCFGADSYPGQVLDLCVRGDAGVATVLLAVLHVPQVEHAGNDVQQFLQRDHTREGGEEKTDENMKDTRNKMIDARNAGRRRTERGEEGGCVVMG